MIDGRCAYLAGDGACELHRRHGAAAKPSGCAIYPATFTFDGEAVRVSLGVECACIAKSLGKKDGAPLVPEGAAARGDLPAGAQVIVLPEAIEIREGVTASRADVVRWSRAVLRAWATVSKGANASVAPVSAAGANRSLAQASEAPGESGERSSSGDAVSVLWALAAKMEAGDLSEEGARAAFEEARVARPTAEALRPWIAALAERAASKRDSADRWRSGRDRVRGLSTSLAEGATSLAEETNLTRALEGEGAARELEAFYVMTGLHGHGWIGEMPLAVALRDRAVRVLLGRALSGKEAVGGGTGDGAALTRVEAMMRAQGIKEYARVVR